MPYTNPHIKLSWEWELIGSDEIGTSSVSLGQYGGIVDYDDWFDAQTANIDEYAGEVAAFWSRTGSLIPAECRLTSVKMALIGVDGLYTREAVEFPVTAVGYYERNFAPQLALVTTLVSNKFKNPGKYGRFYTPCITATTTSGYFIDVQGQTNYIQSAADLINGFNDAGAVPGGAAQANVRLFSSVGVGVEEPVVELRVGRLYDTQRRRRNALTENYISQPLLEV